MTCGYDFEGELLDVLMDAAEKDLNPDEVWVKVKDFLQSVKTHYDDNIVPSEELREQSKIVLNYVDTSYSESDISNIIFGNDIEKEEDSSPSTDTTVITSRKINRNFIDDIYKGASRAKKYVTGEVNFNLASSIIFDRDNGTISVDINKSLKDYQSRLFNVLFEYLKNKNYYSGEDLVLYDKDGKYTGAFEKILDVSENYFSQFDEASISQMFAQRTSSTR
jgi:hypothetical protein